MARLGSPASSASAAPLRSSACSGVAAGRPQRTQKAPVADSFPQTSHGMTAPLAGIFARWPGIFKATPAPGAGQGEGYNAGGWGVPQWSIRCWAGPA